jgi:ribonuclease D
MPTPNQLPLLIVRQTDLDHVCAEIAKHQQIFIDTEFVRTNTYAPQLGLLQIHAGDLTACVDPLAGLDMQRLWELLFDPECTNILHSGKQDMEVMWFTEGAIIRNLADTQICAGLLGYPAQIGYAGLAADLLNVEISKDQTRTDWSRRPLSEAQLRYAAEDVVHLPKMFKIMEERLRELGRFEWAIEDSAELCQISLYKPEPADAWQRVKSIPFMPAAQQARARALATWRETRAVASDKPRQWIIADKALLQLVTENPANETALGVLGELPTSLARSQGRKLISILAAANDAFAQGDMNLQQQTFDIEKEKILGKKLSKLVRAKAEQLGIAAEVLASKRDISALIRDSAHARVLRGWRYEVIGQELQQNIN